MSYKINKEMTGITWKAIASLLFLSLQFAFINSQAQDKKEATMNLSFSGTDSIKTCVVTVTADSLPVKGTDIHLYVKRLYGLLPIGKAITTDDNGVAEISFPTDLPGNIDKMIVVIAKIEGDEVYGDVEAQATVKWGAVSTSESYNWSNRSLSASREKAPMFLVIASISIIMGIWGTILYLVFQLFRIRRSGKGIKKIPATAQA